MQFAAKRRMKIRRQRIIGHDGYEAADGRLPTEKNYRPQTCSSCSYVKLAVERRVKACEHIIIGKKDEVACEAARESVHSGIIGPKRAVRYEAAYRKLRTRIIGYKEARRKLRTRIIGPRHEGGDEADRLRRNRRAGVGRRSGGYGAPRAVTVRHPDFGRPRAPPRRRMRRQPSVWRSSGEPPTAARRGRDGVAPNRRVSPRAGSDAVGGASEAMKPGIAEICTVGMFRSARRARNASDRRGERVARAYGWRTGGSARLGDRAVTVRQKAPWRTVSVRTARRAGRSGGGCLGASLGRV